MSTERSNVVYYGPHKTGDILFNCNVNSLWLRAKGNIPSYATYT